MHIIEKRRYQTDINLLLLHRNLDCGILCNFSSSYWFQVLFLFFTILVDHHCIAHIKHLPVLLALFLALDRMLHVPSVAVIPLLCRIVDLAATEKQMRNGFEQSRTAVQCVCLIELAPLPGYK